MKTREEIISMLEESGKIMEKGPTQKDFRFHMERIETTIEILGTDTPVYYRKKLKEWKEQELFRQRRGKRLT